MHYGVWRNISASHSRNLAGIFLYYSVYLDKESFLELFTQFQFLDSLNLNIHKVTDAAAGQKLDFVIGEPVQYLGSKVEVELPASSNTSSVDIKIVYTTDKNAPGLTWLRPEQTAGKTHPYLFSACEPYKCRSMVPLQG